MNIEEVYKRYPTQADCIKHLEKIIWNNNPVCPYCGYKNQTPLPKENRYHCNICDTTYSVTVRTIFHRTKCDLQKWFLALYLILNEKKVFSARQLAQEIKVTKDTALFIMTRIRKEFVEHGDLLKEIMKNH